jgi:hypothetical protein
MIPSDTGSAREKANVTYDDLRANAVLITCAICHLSYYMETPRAICVTCRGKQK